MIRFLKNALWFFVGLVLAGLPMFALAETIPATNGDSVPVPWSYYTSANTSLAYRASTPQGVCSLYTGGYTYQSGGAYGACVNQYNNFPISRTTNCPSGYSYDGGSLCTKSGYSCPSGQNWTLSGQTCTRPDCVAPQTRQTDGTCKAIDCPTGKFSSGLYKGQPSATACAPNGCTVIFSGTYPTNKDASGNLYASGGYDYAPGGQQGQCTPGGVVPTTTDTPPKTTPPCAEGEGVVTSTSGKVACVPPGTPGAKPPTVTNKTSTKTNSDGSTETTETKTTCSEDGACTETSKSTKTPKSDGSPGEAGPPGESEETKESEPDDHCKTNPNDPACKPRNASGGCESFSCDGDAIDCSIARASWESACHYQRLKYTKAADCNSVPVCEGDVIQCGIAETAWKQRCQMKWAEDPNDLSNEFNAAKAKLDAGTQESIVKTKDASSWFTLGNHVSGPSACPTDIAIPVFGHTITAPIGWLCAYLGIIALILKLSAWLIVGRMAMGAF